MKTPLEPPYDHLYIWCESEVEKTLRAHSVSKEPETLAWVSSMNAWDALYDIGANVGCYSLIAASRGIRVTAFEPMPENVARLRRNQALNGIPFNIEPLAIKETTGLCSFDWSSKEPGSASHTMTEGTDIPGSSLDDWTWTSRHPDPDHLKIDVDGGELGVIRGAERTLKSVQSVQVEIDHNLDTQEIYDRLEAAGLKLVKKSPRSIPGVMNVEFKR